MIHFNLTNSKNYAGVQSQILNAIKSRLPDESWTESEEYNEGALNFSLFINQKSDVLMSHGAADKNYHFRKDLTDQTKRMNHTMGRKHLFVPGDFLKNRLVTSPLLNFGADQVHAVGWPRLDHLLAEQKLYDQKPKMREKKVVLWAPTHDFARRGKNEVSLSSYPEFESFYEKMSDKYEMLQSLHPRNRKDKAPTGNALVEADVVITDFGTMVYEAIALGKQVIFPSWIIGDPIRKFIKNSTEHTIFSQGYGLHANSYKHLCEMIEDQAELDDSSKQFFDSYIGPHTYGASSEMTANLLLKLAER